VHLSRCVESRQNYRCCRVAALKSFATIRDVAHVPRETFARLARLHVSRSSAIKTAGMQSRGHRARGQGCERAFHCALFSTRVNLARSTRTRVRLFSVRCAVHRNIKMDSLSVFLLN